MTETMSNGALFTLTLVSGVILSASLVLLANDWALSRKYAREARNVSLMLSMELRKYMLPSVNETTAHLRFVADSLLSVADRNEMLVRVQQARSVLADVGPLEESLGSVHKVALDTTVESLGFLRGADQEAVGAVVSMFAAISRLRHLVDIELRV
jgi:hypothetical protein